MKEIRRKEYHCVGWRWSNVDDYWLQNTRAFLTVPTEESIGLAYKERLKRGFHGDLQPYRSVCHQSHSNISDETYHMSQT